jgi:hypothetical protein
MVLPLEREHDDNSMHSMMTFVKIKRVCISIWKHKKMAKRAYRNKGISLGRK